MTKENTMVATAKEGAALVDGAVDPDAKTRGQQKQIDELNGETTPAAHKVRVMNKVSILDEYSTL